MNFLYYYYDIVTCLICKEFSCLHLSHFFSSFFVTFSQTISHTIYRKDTFLSFVQTTFYDNILQGGIYRKMNMYHSLSSDTVQKKLNSSTNGLSSKEVSTLRKTYGFNELQGQNRKPKFVEQ